MTQPAPVPEAAPVPPTPLIGLTQAEAAARLARGQGNNVKIATSRTYRDIFMANVINPINVVLFVLGGVMIGIGRFSDAAAGVGLIVFNLVIGMIQEVRAKRQLDEIALLTRPKVTARREGQEFQMDPAGLVVGDLMVIRPGDQLVVDGTVVGDNQMEVDESLLTGEADAILKGPGQAVLSGSFCVSGSALVQATKVGNESYANTLTANARKYRIAHTPLQREVNVVLRLLMSVAIFILGLVLASAVLDRVPFMRQVQMAAVIVGLVPNGLLATMIIAYALGALRIVRHGALVQQSNAVESLSNVTVLCTDKTGTLTTNKITYHDLHTPERPVEDVRQVLATFASSVTSANKTAEALQTALPGTAQKALDEVPFTSARKWSGLVLESGAYVLGAAEMLADNLPLAQADHQRLQDWSGQGLRVLAFGHNPTSTSLHDDQGQPFLPQLTLLGLVAFSDELRPQLKETLTAFKGNGVALKIISGDNPETVAALAKQAGWEGEVTAVSGLALAQMNAGEFKQAAQASTVFGRITPEQKEQLVQALRDHGHYVAMIGDGVNDVLSLKKADLGIAMESGSAAARGVANLVLLGDSFAALPHAFSEGQRIVNGMKDILRLYLTRVLYTALLIVAAAILGSGFPFAPKPNALLSFFTVGAPAVALALWARPGALPRRSLLRDVARFVLPAAISIFVTGLAVYLVAYYAIEAGLINTVMTPEALARLQALTGINLPTQALYTREAARLAGQAALTMFVVYSGLLLVIFVEPPNEWWVAGEAYSGDWRPTWLTVVMGLVFIVILAVPAFSAAFELIQLPFWGYALIILVTVIWMLVLRLAWRHRWLERWLGVDL